jgi:hypothetical protein
MRFVHPEILYFLGFLAIPIIIHLFNFRRYKTVYFSDVRLLRNIQEETKSRSRLKHWLILLSRLLLIAFLVLAFAQPYFPDDNSKNPGRYAVSIYLDNSYSMGLEKEGVSLLDLSRQRVLEIIEAYSDADLFQLITNDFEGRHSRFVNKAEFEAWIDELTISPQRANLAEVYARQKDILLRPEENKAIWWVSDFQSGMVPEEDWMPDTTLPQYWVPMLADEYSNLYVDSVWFTTPYRSNTEPDELMVRVANKGKTNKEDVALSLVVNDLQLAVNTLNIASGESKDIAITFNPTGVEMNQAKISIEDFPIVYDDHLFFSYRAGQEINSLVIENTENRVFKALYSSFGFPYESKRPEFLEFNRFGENEVIILSGLKTLNSGIITELEKFVVEGGSVFILPEDDIDLNSYKALCERLGLPEPVALMKSPARVGKIDMGDELFEGVFESERENMDLPALTKYFDFNLKSTLGYEVPARLDNGKPFLIRKNLGKGKAYISAVGVSGEFGNFAQHAIFPATLYRVCLLSIPNQPLYFTLGELARIQLSNEELKKEIPFRLVSKELEVIPEQRIQDASVEMNLTEGVKQSGTYNLMQEDRTLGLLSVNQSREESVLNFLSSKELEDRIEANNWAQVSLINEEKASLKSALTLMNRNAQWWKWCIMLALLFLLTEVLLIKLWRK